MANPAPEKKSKLREILISVVVLAVVVTALGIFFSRVQLIQGPSLSGNSAPEIEFEAPNGKKMSVSRHKGKVVLLNFWASWCAPCLEEMPTLKMLETHFKGQGFVVLAFNIGESPEVIQGRLSSPDFPDNVIFNFKKEFLRPYDIRGIPVSILVDSVGIIRQVYTGPRNWMDSKIIREIEALLKPAPR